MTTWYIFSPGAAYIKTLKTEQIKFLKGENTIDVAEKHGIGLQTYNLIDVDEHEPEPEPDNNNDDTDNEKITLYISIGAVSLICLGLIIAIIILCVKRKSNSNEAPVGSVSLLNRDTNA